MITLQYTIHTSPDPPSRMRSAVVSKTARTLDVGAAVFLSNMAELFVMELERKWALATPHTAQLHRPVAAYHSCVLLVDAHKPGWPVLLSSTAAANELGAWAKFKILCFFWLMFRSICKEARSGEFLFALLVV